MLNAQPVCLAISAACGAAQCCSGNGPRATVPVRSCKAIDAPHCRPCLWAGLYTHCLHTEKASLPAPLQRRLGVWAYSLIVLTSVIFWFGGLSDCSRSAFQYHGMPTTEVGSDPTTITLPCQLESQLLMKGSPSSGGVAFLQQDMPWNATLEQSAVTVLPQDPAVQCIMKMITT
jgi:hypothetical protein